jgi:cytoskeletal protein CcmA (bactofilin family)
MYMKQADKDIQMLGPQVVLEGSLVFEGTLYMNAVIHADVFVRTATIKGEIKGKVSATERIEIHPPARVYGDINAPAVQIDAGVIIEGKCTIRPKEDASSQIDQMLATNAEKIAKPMKSSRESQAPLDSAKNNELGTSAQK